MTIVGHIFLFLVVVGAVFAMQWSSNAPLREARRRVQERARRHAHPIHGLPL